MDSWAIRLRPLQRIVVPFVMQSLHWLNPRTLAALDTREQLHLVDVRSQSVLEVTDLAGAGLVYGSSHFKGLATGGNVSEAMVSGRKNLPSVRTQATHLTLVFRFYLSNGEEYEFLKTLSFKRAQKTMKNPTAHGFDHPIAGKPRLKSLVTSQFIRIWYEL